MAIWFIFTLVFFLFPQPLFASSVVINEVYPNPPGGGAEKDEFIELYNKDEQDIDISGWSIDDIKDGGSKPYFFAEETVISAKAFLVLYREVSKVALNNTGDEVWLLDLTDNEIDGYSFEKTAENVVYGRSPDGESWAILTANTPGEPNALPQPTETLIPTKTPSPKPTLRPTKTPTSFETAKQNLSLTADSPKVIDLDEQENLTGISSIKSLRKLSTTLSSLNFPASISGNLWRRSTVSGIWTTDSGVVANDKNSDKKLSAFFVILGGILLIIGALVIYPSTKKTTGFTRALPAGRQG